MEKYNINANLICVNERLYDKTTSAIAPQARVQDCRWSGTECLLVPTLFYNFIERTMTDAIGHHEGTSASNSQTTLL